MSYHNILHNMIDPKSEWNSLSDHIVFLKSLEFLKNGSILMSVDANSECHRLIDCYSQPPNIKLRRIKRRNTPPNKKPRRNIKCKTNQIPAIAYPGNCHFSYCFPPEKNQRTKTLWCHAVANPQCCRLINCMLLAKDQNEVVEVVGVSKVLLNFR